MGYGQFCPVAKAAEVFADRWTPLILRELCYGPRVFGDFLFALPLISRTMLAQRLKELERAGVMDVEPKPKGRGSVYRLTQAGEAFRPLIEQMSLWGQLWGQGRIGPEDLDSKLLLWGMRRQIDPTEIPERDLVVRFEFRAIPKGNRSPRYWWLVIRRSEIDVCLKNPGFDVDVVVAAELGAFTKVWLGYAGLQEAVKEGLISIHGPERAVAAMRRVLRLPDAPVTKKFVFAPFPSRAPASEAA